MFKDKNDKISMTSVMKFFVTSSIMIMWILICLHKKELVTIPTELVFLICGSLGVGVLNKSVDILNKKDKNENKSDN